MPWYVSARFRTIDWGRDGKEDESDASQLTWAIVIASHWYFIFSLFNSFALLATALHCQGWQRSASAHSHSPTPPSIPHLRSSASTKSISAEITLPRSRYIAIAFGRLVITCFGPYLNFNYFQQTAKSKCWNFWAKNFRIVIMVEQFRSVSALDCTALGPFAVVCVRACVWRQGGRCCWRCYWICGQIKRSNLISIWW